MTHRSAKSMRALWNYCRLDQIASAQTTGNYRIEISEQDLLECEAIDELHHFCEIY